MSWMCPHDDKDQCRRRKAKCKPGKSGCVREGCVAPPPWDAPEASPISRENGEISDELRSKTIDAMKAVLGLDERRIEHAMKVLGFTENILACEPANREVVVAAAILHDIGIHQAEIKYGSAAGRYQEIEGPPIARDIMEKLGFDEAAIEHVCRIIANHHSARDIDTPEFRIVWDADWLVNIPDEFPQVSRDLREKIIARVFKTATGRNLAKSLYLAGD